MILKNLDSGGQGNKKFHFQSWLETNSSGIGIARGW